ncbi:hypothetical protein BpHYR1_011558 [Brachionus plicatilis]|uniref:Uncharacterized protein n=1 Tax=Brachionus plicatilis TaxID=10195 RepID=A0A3M7SRI7_BRAPC|nr:hypothetical protein BpHYR1_011558 [Brachionus plicatilis]
MEVLNYVYKIALKSFSTNSKCKMYLPIKIIQKKNLTFNDIFLTSNNHFRKCNMLQHLKLHQLSKSANDVQNLCKMHCT